MIRTWLAAASTAGLLIGCGGGGGGGAPGLGLSNVREEPGRARSAVITPDGGSVSVTGGSGVVYTLDVPPGSVAQDTEITLYPLSGLSGLPGGESIAAGVHFEPSGLKLPLGAMLSVQLPPGMDPRQLMAISYEGNAEQLRPSMMAAQGQAVTIAVHHFSGTVLGNRSLASLLDDITGNTQTVQFQTTMAGLLYGPLDTELKAAAYQQTLHNWFLSVVRPALQAAIGPPVTADALNQAVVEYTAWLDAILLARLDLQNPAMPVEDLELSELLAVELIKTWYAFFNDMCARNPNGDLTAASPEQNPLSAAGSAIAGAENFLARWGIPGAPEGLDRESLLNDLCAKVVIEKIEIGPPGMAPGDLGQLGVTAGFTIAGGTVRRDPRIRISIQQGTTLSGINPAAGLTDAQGRFIADAAWPSSLSSVSARVLGCVNSPHARIRRICRADQRTFAQAPITITFSDLPDAPVQLCDRFFSTVTVSGNVADKSVSVTGARIIGFNPTSGETSLEVDTLTTPGVKNIVATSNARPELQATATYTVDPILGQWHRSDRPPGEHVVSVFLEPGGVYRYQATQGLPGIYTGTAQQGTRTGGFTIRISGGPLGATVIFDGPNPGDHVELPVRHSNCMSQ